MPSAIEELVERQAILDPSRRGALALDCRERAFVEGGLPELSG